MITVIGKQSTTHEQLHDIKTKRPERAGRVWSGIPHGELVDAFHDEVRLRGWTITSEQYALNPTHTDLAGAMELVVPGVEAPEGHTLSLGFLTSNNMRRSLKVVVGTRVLVCHNGMATGQILMNRKHTTGFNLYDEMDEALDTYVEKAMGISQVVEQLRARNLTANESEHILMTAGRAGIMPWSRIGQVDAEYSHPTYADHNERTCYGLLQAFTHIVKKNPPLEQMQQMNSFRSLLPGNN